jgi:AraC-like DNA-binding protein
MSGGITTLATSCVPRSDRLGFWSGALARLCGRLLTDAAGADTLDARIDYGAIDRLKLCRIEVSRHRVMLSPELARTEKHPVVKIVLQESGSTIFEQGGERVELSPGMGIAYDVSRPHKITSRAATRHLVVIVPKDIAARRGLRLNDLASRRFSTGDGVGRLAYDLVRATMLEMPSIAPESEGELAETILNLVSLPLAAAPRGLPVPSPTTLLNDQVRSYIRAHLRDPELCIDRIAAALSYSKRYLHMCFADQGMTIAEYIWMERLEQCRRALALSGENGQTVTDIAFSHGFNSSSHFSRIFKKRFGYPPSRLLGRAMKTLDERCDGDAPQ